MCEAVDWMVDSMSGTKRPKPELKSIETMREESKFWEDSGLAIVL